MIRENIKADEFVEQFKELLLPFQDECLLQLPSERINSEPKCSISITLTYFTEAAKSKTLYEIQKFLTTPNFEERLSWHNLKYNPEKSHLTENMDGVSLTFTYDSP